MTRPDPHAKADIKPVNGGDLDYHLLMCAYCGRPQLRLLELTDAGPRSIVHCMEPDEFKRVAVGYLTLSGIMDEVALDHGRRTSTMELLDMARLQLRRLPPSDLHEMKCRFVKAMR